MNERTTTLLRRTDTALAVALAGAVMGMLVGPWPRWWRWIAPEQTPMTWLQSILLVLCGFVCLLLAAHGWLADEAPRPGERRVFLLLAVGFAWLALDERFALHERVRDSWLAPRGVELPLLPWVGPGDFVLIGYAVAGLALLRPVLRVLRDDERALRLFAAGVVCAVIVVSADSIDVRSLSTGAERIEQTLEEIVELASDALFLLALLTLHLHQVAGLTRARIGVGGAVR
jgi:hypothetical protein